MTDSMINEFDRVTSVLYPFSGLTKVDPAVLSNAAARGAIVHQACQCLILDIPMDNIPDEYMGYINSFKLWFAGKEFLPHPGRWYDHDKMITGECDGLYKEEGQVCLFDLKTPARQGSTWHLQGSAYSYLAQRHEYREPKILFIRLDKKGGYPTTYEYKYAIEEFFLLLDVYRKYFKNKMSEVDYE